MFLCCLQNKISLMTAAMWEILQTYVNEALFIFIAAPFKLSKFDFSKRASFLYLFVSGNYIANKYPDL